MGLKRKIRKVKELNGVIGDWEDARAIPSPVISIPPQTDSGFFHEARLFGASDGGMEITGRHID